MTIGGWAFLLFSAAAFQRFIEDYSPPPYQAVDKHLKQMLDRQINFITHCRPHSIAMGGTIRWLKRRLTSEKRKLSFLCKMPINIIRNLLRQYKRIRL